MTPTNLKELSEKHGFKPTGILHIGASELNEAQIYKDMGVSKVIWVEALPHDEKRENKAKEFGHELFEHLPLSDKCECIEFYVSNNEVSSSMLPFKRHAEVYPDIVVKKKLRMMTVRADTLFGKGLPPEIDTLVIDVQGAELKVLEGMGKLLEQIQRAFLEVNLKEMYSGCVLKPELDDWMAKAGFGNSEFYPVHDEEWGEGFWWR